MDTIDSYTIRVKCKNCNYGVNSLECIAFVDICKGVLVNEFLKVLDCSNCGCKTLEKF